MNSPLLKASGPQWVKQNKQTESHLNTMKCHLFLSPSSFVILVASIFTFGLITTNLFVTGLNFTHAFAQEAKNAGSADSTPITIEAKEFLEWNQKEGTYIAKGNAFVQQNQSNITADHIIASYDINSKSRDITRVVATGVVTYIEGENTARGDKLDYDLTNSLYVLTGKKSSLEGPRGIMTATESIKYDATDTPNRKVTAIGKARYKDSNGRTVFGEKLIANIGSDGTLKTINGYENTKVTTNNGTTATADRLTYVADTGLANLNGNVEITNEENVLRGAKAKIDFNRETSRIISIPGGKRVSGTLSP